MPYGGGYSRLSSKNSKIDQYNFIKKSKRGAILIEFAFAVPVLFSLIYYVHDLARYRQLQTRMQFIATEIVGILQNMHHTITKKDIANAMQMAYLSMFPGNTMDGEPNGRVSYPLGYYPYIHIMLVKGEGNDQASGKWVLKFWGGGNKYIGQAAFGQSSLRYDTKIHPAIYFWPELKISDGEYKIIIQCSPYYDHGDKLGETFSAGPHAGKKCGEVPARTAFDFYIITPQGVGSYKNGFFPANIIFTPKPGSFSETPPQ